MIDELDLAFEGDQVDRTKPRHRRRNGKGRTAVAFAMVFVLLGVLGVGGYLGFEKIRGFFTAADYDGGGTDAVQVVLKQGSLTEIGNTLVEADVVKSTRAFTDAAEENPRGKNIQPGTYNLKKQMSGASAVTLLLDPKARVTNGVTIEEGWTSVEVYATLAKASGLPVKDFQAAAKDLGALGIQDFWFNRTDGQKVTKSVEGFLFPDTYEFPPKATAAEHLSIMVEHFMKVTEEIDFVKKAEQERNISPYEVLIVASLAQAEAGNKDDLAKVARVAYNRLYVPTDELGCKCLEYDVGINYYYKITGRKAKPSGSMTAAELRDPKNPYRLHEKEGLTPTPINNPSRAAMEGALAPAKGDWYYFVAIDKQGHSAFAETNAEHNRNIERAKEAGIL